MRVDFLEPLVQQEVTRLRPTSRLSWINSPTAAALSCRPQTSRSTRSQWRTSASAASMRSAASSRSSSNACAVGGRNCAGGSVRNLQPEAWRGGRGGRTASALTRQSARSGLRRLRPANPWTLGRTACLVTKAAALVALEPHRVRPTVSRSRASSSISDSHAACLVRRRP